MPRHAPGAPASPRRSVETGDRPLASPSHDPACPDTGKGATRWVDSDPHTPFFVSDDQGLHGDAGACCAEWAVPGTQWRTLDAYGQVVGHAELSGGEGYDVTQCYELSFKQLGGRKGVGLYASDQGAWKPAPSVKWLPSKAERTAFADFVSRAKRLLADDRASWARDKPLPLDQRTLYFQIDGSLWKHDQKVEHYAVAGGRLLIIARLNEKGRWIASHLDTEITNNGAGVIRAYRPLAVFDIDGDGAPEVIFHSNVGDGWNDTLLHLDDNGQNWLTVAESVGGSTA